MPYSFNDGLKNSYEFLFDTCVIKPSKYKEVDACVDRIVAGKLSYEQVGSATGIPWYFIGIIHSMECSCNFRTHLHNGDPLTARTVHVPKGYPKKGTPPFTWNYSAEDALKLKGLDKWTEWNVPGILFQFESYNGFGYRSKGINTPYLWSFSNQYTKGKFVKDGVFSATAVSQQIGAAVLLRRMSERQIAIAGETDNISLLRQLGAGVTFDPAVYHEAAEELQKLLNKLGQHLRIDGKAGRNTSDAYERVTGNYLQGDPLSV
jgi:lysozyme family protein